MKVPISKIVIKKPEPRERLGRLVVRPGVTPQYWWFVWWLGKPHTRYCQGMLGNATGDVKDAIALARKTFPQAVGQMELEPVTTVEVASALTERFMQSSEAQ